MYERNVAQSGDAHALLRRSLSDCCAPLMFFDPQHRENLDHLKYGNEGAPQRKRCELEQTPSEYIDACCREAARALMPSGYLLRWHRACRLLWLLNGRRLIALTADTAAIETPTGGQQTYRRRAVEIGRAVPAWEMN
jgi:hypothetical protein